ncbi:MAG: MlaD family protein [Rhodospirillales bacterium]
MGRNLIESIMGAVVLVIAGLFMLVAYNTVSFAPDRGYELTASFLKVGGLQRGNDVRIAGIKVGTVVDQSLDPVTYDAIIRINVNEGIRLPVDSEASIASEGLLGGAYLQVKPGSGTEMLTAGARIEKTRDFKAFEEQVGEVIFLATGAGN